jgi:hypothetical protein
MAAMSSGEGKSRPWTRPPSDSRIAGPSSGYSVSSSRPQLVLSRALTMPTATGRLVSTRGARSARKNCAAPYELSHFTENDDPSELRLVGVARVVPLSTMVISLALKAASDPLVPDVLITDEPE